MSSILEIDTIWNKNSIGGPRSSDLLLNNLILDLGLCAMDYTYSWWHVQTNG
jgi:hypothetical protein